MAAVMVEPLLGSHGFLTGTTEYLQAMQQISAEYGALFNLDEVKTFRLDTGGGRAESTDRFDHAGAKAVSHGGTLVATPW